MPLQKSMVDFNNIINFTEEGIFANILHSVALNSIKMSVEASCRRDINQITIEAPINTDASVMLQYPHNQGFI